MRDLKPREQLVLDVRLDEDRFEVFCRQPTTTEVLAYNRNLYDFDSNGDGPAKAKTAIHYDTMLDAALGIITGWTPGAFGLDGKQISPDPQSPDYCAEWKTILRSNEPRLLLGIAGQVFGGVLVEKKRPFSPS